MNIINTRLVRDGNSVAVRLPKYVLAMSGLKDEIQMEVEHGHIILRSPRISRNNWADQIMKVLSSHPIELLVDEELDEWEVTSSDGFE